MIGRVSALRAADRLNLAFLLLLVAITLFFCRKVDGPGLLIVLYSCIFCTQLLLIRFKTGTGVLGWIYDLIFPTVSILLIFDSLGRLVHFINPNDIDPFLIKLDYLLFSGHPTIMLEKVNFPVLTDALQLAYISYYFLPIALGIALKKKRLSEAFDFSIFLIMLCFYLSYIGYMLTPAIGPRFTLAHLQGSEMRGLLVAAPIQHLLNGIEGIKRDAFPSGHTGIALTVLYLAWRFERRLFRWFLPFVIALIISTVYLRYHYVVDVIAGVALALITIFAGEEYYYGCGNKRICLDN